MRPSTLKHHKRFALKNRAYPAVVPQKDSEVHGKLVTDITQKEMALLDEYEGSEYKRETVKVQCENVVLEAQVKQIFFFQDFFVS